MDRFFCIEADGNDVYKSFFLYVVMHPNIITIHEPKFFTWFYNAHIGYVKYICGVPFRAACIVINQIFNLYLQIKSSTSVSSESFTNLTASCGTILLKMAHILFFLIQRSFFLFSSKSVKSLKNCISFSLFSRDNHVFCNMRIPGLSKK